MRKLRLISLGMFTVTLLPATLIDTNNAAAVSAFQAGASVTNFESISGIIPLAISSYTDGTPITAGATLFNQISGVEFSVGGTPGTFDTEPVVLTLTGGIAGDAASPTNVLGGADMQGNTNFGGGPFLEIFFPTKVNRVGFWLNPSLGTVELIAANTNFAFSGIPETNLEVDTNVTPGNFVGIQLPTAEIGGFKVISTTGKGFTLDDFTFGGASTSTVPEPATFGLFAAVLAGFAARRTFRRKRA